MRTLLAIVASLVISTALALKPIQSVHIPRAWPRYPATPSKKNPGGSWTQVATLIAGGALIPAGNNFKNTAESRIIEKKCDKQ